MPRTRHYCKIDDCEKPAAGRGLCKMHYHRWLRHGSPDIVLTGKGRAGRPAKPKPVDDNGVPITARCTVDGCPKPQHSHTYCPAHYRRWKDYGDPVATRDTRPDPGQTPDHLKHYLERRRARIAAADRRLTPHGQGT